MIKPVAQQLVSDKPADRRRLRPARKPRGVWSSNPAEMLWGTMVGKKVVMAVKRSRLGRDDFGATFLFPFRRGVSHVQLPATGLFDRGRGVRGRHDRNSGRDQAGWSRRQAASADPRQGGASIIGPTNPAREAQNVDRLAPPPTDHGTMPNLRFSFADGHNRLQPGGWARQMTVRELHIARSLLRQHAAQGRRGPGDALARAGRVGVRAQGPDAITAVDGEGHAFQDDISEGNIWNFPGGIPHSLQGLEGDGCEFLLVFNDGNFNEDATFLVTDFLAHIPKEVLAKNFGVPESAFANIPKEELYIFESQVPGPLAADRVVGAGPVPLTYSHQLMDQEPIQTKGGRSASSTPPISRRPRRSPPGWSRSSPAGCASCTGTRTRTSCNTTSRASRG